MERSLDDHVVAIFVGSWPLGQFEFGGGFSVFDLAVLVAVSVDEGVIFEGNVFVLFLFGVRGGQFEVHLGEHVVEGVAFGRDISDQFLAAFFHWFLNIIISNTGPPSPTFTSQPQSKSPLCGSAFGSIGFQTKAPGPVGRGSRSVRVGCERGPWSTSHRVGSCRTDAIW